ncbi:MAG: T9SS type A sorting domain-containing protein [Saprospiraceae bacterium]|nr:T9SS type A sorting domain-containing protein [Saprospiraceae bacterium]
MTSPPKLATRYCRLVSVLILLVSFHGMSYAQIVTRSVVNTNGFSKVLDNGYITISVGESAVQTLNGVAGIITQGFLQPELEPPCSDFELDYFPNPVLDFLTIRDTACGRIISRIQVYDLLGNQVMERKLVNREADLSLLGNGIFLVQGYSMNDTVLGTFKIVKVAHR